MATDTSDTSELVILVILVILAILAILAILVIGQQDRNTAVSKLKIGISHNTKCAIRDSFHRDCHI